ncbi:MAG: C2H2-type zinc finger protein, partial [Thermoplasmata archaeon]
GKGKSNFAAWAIEKVLETRPTWDVYTTLPFPWDPSGGGPPEGEPWGRIHPVSSLSEVLRGAAESAQAGRVPAVVIDEMDQAVTSHDWMSEEARSWQRLVNIERHLRIRGPLLVYHAYRHIPVVLREGTMLKSMMQVIVKDGAHWVIRREEEGFLYVPATVLPYLAYGLRGFDIDVDVQDMERHLNGSAEAVRQQLLAYLDQQEARRAEQAERAAEWNGPPECRECGLRFSRRDALVRHRRTVHGSGV